MDQVEVLFEHPNSVPMNADIKSRRRFFFCSISGTYLMWFGVIATMNLMLAFDQLEVQHSKMVQRLAAD